jgi:peptidoglycan/LPS O-acetylase OafA/YrhL
MPPLLLLVWLVGMSEHSRVHSVLAYMLFCSNFASTTSWTISLLGLTWSLAVEEHFYLVFPFAVRTMKRTGLLWLLGSTVVIEPFLRLAATSHVHSFLTIYFWTFFRLDGLSLGCILALLIEDARSAQWITRWSGYLATATAIAYVAIYATRIKQFTETANSHLFNFAGYTLISLTFAFTVAYILQHPAARISRVLSSRPIVFVGTISYGMYLYHIPIYLHLARWTKLSDLQVFPISLASTIIFSWLSYNFYETYFTRWSHRATTDSVPTTVSEDSVRARSFTPM